MASCKRNVCGLFQIAATSSVYLRNAGMKSNELERIGKEAFVAHFTVLSRNLSGEIEESHKKSQ